jgi:hypothetical protein
MLKALIVGIAVAGAVAPRLTVQPARSPRWPSHAAISVWIDVRTAPPAAAALVDRAIATWTQAADGVYGETAPHVDRTTGAIGSAEVLIGGVVSGDARRQRVVIYLTALHELGHALGLPHTDAFDDIMYSFRRPDDGERYFGAYERRLRSIDDIGTERATGLSPADLAAIRVLYDR